MGLSPLARGNLRDAANGLHVVGPIPARAGQPWPAHCWAAIRRAYPRSRGATFPAAGKMRPIRGLSPLARGNHWRQGGRGRAEGPIPARAGQPKTCAASWTRARAYPRSRGATTQHTSGQYGDKGLSPLARGNRAGWSVNDARSGPIPARAGQPLRRRGETDRDWAYPRSRGATAAKGQGDEDVKGLSPLARGNRAFVGITDAVRGPIPARAGQPWACLGGCRSPRAYPRSRGATRDGGVRSQAARGLSPLARGNLTAATAKSIRPGPIPARAGQPCSHQHRRWRPWAYPRSRGATLATSLQGVNAMGLSPLARGNPDSRGVVHHRSGPIPARAGQPVGGVGMARSVWAYPRSRGATGPSCRFCGRAMGLSPLARGNPRPRRCRARSPGPIPARAGQPRHGSKALAGVMGLSPLARGNPAGMLRFHPCGGPIPARAGQPSATNSWPRESRAYPRSRGATRRRQRFGPAHRGLSPLARGNQSPGLSRRGCSGPIPARAGQPRTGGGAESARRAYPRSRGATLVVSRPRILKLGLSPLARGNRASG